MKAMFQANQPIEPKPALVKRKMPAYTGIAAFVDQFETVKPEPRPHFETPKERQARVKKATLEANEAKLQLAIEGWDPHKVRSTDSPCGDVHSLLRCTARESGASDFGRLQNTVRGSTQVPRRAFPVADV
jgi:hypothetical protein